MQIAAGARDHRVWKHVFRAQRAVLDADFFARGFYARGAVCGVRSVRFGIVGLGRRIGGGVFCGIFARRGFL